jgi:protein-S-isoprenylcysteine O-methyltransferase Ste14
VTLRSAGTANPLLRSTGDFLFHYRGLAIPLIVVTLLLFGAPARALQDAAVARAFTIAGIAVAALGQLLRFLVVGFAYIKRGGKNRRIYADDLVVEGVYAHVRNPMYVGNFLILVGLALVYGSPLGFAVAVPAIAFVYFCIVLSEEAYLREKFGAGYEAYARDVNRFVPRLRGLGTTIEGSHYDWRKALRKEYGTPHGLGWAIAALILLRGARLDGFAAQRGLFLIVLLIGVPWTVLYLALRRWKEAGGLDSRVCKGLKSRLP